MPGCWSLHHEQMRPQRCGGNPSVLRGGSWWRCGTAAFGGSGSGSGSRASVALSRLLGRAPTKLRRTGIFAEVTGTSFISGSDRVVVVGDAEGKRTYSYSVDIDLDSNNISHRLCVCNSYSNHGNHTSLKAIPMLTNRRERTPIKVQLLQWSFKHRFHSC